MSDPSRSAMTFLGDFDAECFLCRSARLSEDELTWYDRPVLRGPERAEIVVPALGAFAPGHVLVAPKEHVFNSGWLTRDRLSLFGAFLVALVSAIEASVGPVTVFEHGSCFDNHSQRSACTEHAHVQIVPGRYGLEPSGIYDSCKSLEGFFSSPRQSSPGYLMFKNPGGPVYVMPDPGVSQYVRRLIAARLGEDDDWDYLVFPRLSNVGATVDLLRSVTVAGQAD